MVIHNRLFMEAFFHALVHVVTMPPKTPLKRKSATQKTASPAKKIAKEDNRELKTLDFFFGKARERTNERLEVNKESNSWISKNEKDVYTDGKRSKLFITENEEILENLQDSVIQENELKNETEKTKENNEKLKDDVYKDYEVNDDDRGFNEIREDEELRRGVEASLKESPKNSSAIQLTSSTSIAATDFVPNSMPTTNDLSSTNYDPLATPPWHPQSSAPYSFLTQCLSAVSSTTSRLKILTILTNTICTLLHHDPTSLLSAIYLLTNTLAPTWDGIELGIGAQALFKSISAVSGASRAGLKSLYERLGDWGDVAFEAKVSVRLLSQPPPLTIVGVYSILRQICKLKGQGSVDGKANLAQKMLLAARGEETRYLTRTLAQHLRVGAVRTSVLVALARAVCLVRPKGSVEPGDEDEFFIRVGDEKETREKKLKEVELIFRRAYAQRPTWDDIVPIALRGGVRDVKDQCGAMAGIPLRPMLGKITRDLGDVFSKLEGREMTCEWKYDGQRAQIHMLEGGQVRIFSRHLEDITSKFPDIVALIPKVISAETSSFIMDAEVVAINQHGRMANFQALASRARKDVAITDITVNVCIYTFDLMYHNSTSLLTFPLCIRRDLLRKHFTINPGQFELVRHMDTRAEAEKLDEVAAFFHESITTGCEGLMVKVLDHVDASNRKRGSEGILASYEPDKRIDSWLKVKKDYLDGISDSLDLVPIGAWYGNGRKAGWFSPILLACWNPEREVFETVCKCMSGFSDAFYKEMKTFYTVENQRILLSGPRGYYDVDDDLRPTVWFDACEVWEIKGADMTISPTHRAAVSQVQADRGLSLRFPRFIRKREDKSIEEATTSKQIAEMYFAQTKREDRGDEGGWVEDGADT